jgi:hypothetical protein
MIALVNHAAACMAPGHLLPLPSHKPTIFNASRTLCSLFCTSQSLNVNVFR